MKRWLHLAVPFAAAACLALMTACEPSDRGTDADEDKDKDKDEEVETTEVDLSRLRGITWELKSWGRTGKENKPLSGTTINLKFDDSDDLSGNAGCNYYVADYTATTLGAIDVDDLHRTTSYGCSTARRNQEDEYLDNLRDVTRLEFEDDGDLRLYYDDEDFMIFE